MRLSFFLSVVVPGLSVLVFAGPAASQRLDISGYGKTHTVAYDRADAAGGDVLWSSNNRVRINARFDLTSWLGADLSYDLVARIQDKRLFAPDLSAYFSEQSAYRVSDIDSYIYPDGAADADNAALLNNLDRLYFTVSAPSFDLIVGRQALAWGSAHAINPTDIFTPYLYNEIDTEDRIGVDAVRLRVPAGMLGEVDAGFVGGEDFEMSRSAMYARCRLNAAGTDAAVLLAGFRENILVGVDVTRALGGAGAWVEGAYVFVDGFDDRSRMDERTDYLRGSVGIDYNFPRGVYTFLEYHYNDAGSNDPDAYLERVQTPAYQEGTVYLLGRHYLVPGVSFQATPLVSVFAEVLVNLSDSSVLLAPTIEYNVSDNLYLGAGGFAGLGKSSDTELASTYFGADSPYAGTGDLIIPLYRSEFGAYPGIYYLSFRFYY